MPLKSLSGVNQPSNANGRLRYTINHSQRIAHESASVPIISTWAKQEMPPPPYKRTHRTWQELSFEINQFAADNMKNAGWDDLWTTSTMRKSDQQVDETDLSHLSSQRLIHAKTLESNYIAKQAALKVKGRRSRSPITTINHSQRIAHESASVPIISKWAKQEMPPPPYKSAHRTWQELSSEINQFAADNMKNAGWDDLWTTSTMRKSDQQVDETDLAYLSTISLQDISKAEMVFQKSLLSQQKLQAWDKMMGLKRSHSRMMTKSSVTRKKMIHALQKLKMTREKEIR